MAAQPSSALTMLTACFSAEHLEAAARRTGLVTRAAKMTGQLLLALVPCGVWRDAHTARAPWAAQGTHLDDQRARSPEAISQRLHQGALAFLQDMIRHARANVHGRENVGEEGLCPRFPQGSRAERTGCALPDRRPALLPGSGGRAAKAGAKIPAGWDDKSRVWAHGALTPWTRPDQTSSDTGVA